MDVGSESTSKGAASDPSKNAQIGPTHVTSMWRRQKDVRAWSDWSPNGRHVDFDDTRNMFEWYGNDYTRALHGQGIDYRDAFERSGRDDFPGWTLYECGVPPVNCDIFIHYDGDEDIVRRWSHVHADYGNPNSYLLMRRPKDDSYTGSTIVVEFGYGEDLAIQAGRFFGVWSTSPTDTQMGIGVNTDRCTNNKYFYRWGPHPINQWTCDTVSRDATWHIFRFYIKYPSDGCSYGEIDGQAMTQKNCDITPGNLSTWGVASAWGLTDPPNLDGIWDNAVYFHR